MLSPTARTVGAALAAFACGLSPWAGRAARGAGPTPAMALPCEVTEVYDGDTLTVRLTLDLRVRLIDCWAPEVRTRDAGEKARGVAAREHLRDLAEGERGVLEVTLEDFTRLDDVLTLGRVLGRVWVGDVDLSAAQVAAGHAATQKAERSVLKERSE